MRQRHTEAIAASLLWNRCWRRASSSRPRTAKRPNPLRLRRRSYDAARTMSAQRSQRPVSFRDQGWRAKERRGTKSFRRLNEIVASFVQDRRTLEPCLSVCCQIRPLIYFQAWNARLSRFLPEFQRFSAMTRRARPISNICWPAGFVCAHCGHQKSPIVPEPSSVVLRCRPAKEHLVTVERSCGRATHRCHMFWRLSADDADAGHVACNSSGSWICRATNGVHAASQAPLAW